MQVLCWGVEMPFHRADCRFLPLYDNCAVDVTVSLIVPAIFWHL